MEKSSEHLYVCVDREPHQTVVGSAKMGGGYLHVHGGGHLLSTIRHIVIIHYWFVVSSPAIVGGVVGGFVVVSFIVALFVLAGVAVRRCRGSKVDGAPEEGVDKPGKSPPPLARSPSEHNNYWHMPGRVVQEEAIEMSPSVKLLGKKLPRISLVLCSGGI